MSRVRLLLLGLASLALIAPPPALAHGIHADAAVDSIADFERLGIRHMITGWDHLLFIGGIVLLAGNALRAAKLLSLFVAGHSLTLLIATLAGWRFSATAVDVVIALSVAYIGFRIVGGRPERWPVTGAIIFGFGLGHGLGLATRLQELDLPGGGALVARVIAFNVGVEIGQLAVLAVVAALALVAVRSARGQLDPIRAAGAALVVTGLVAASVLALSLAIRGDEPASASSTAFGSCREQPSTIPVGLAGSGHPDRLFYGPRQTPSVAKVAHVILDGYIVVKYQPDLPKHQRQTLATWANKQLGIVALANDDESPPTVEASTRYRMLVCDDFELHQLAHFRDRWIALRRRGA